MFITGYAIGAPAVQTLAQAADGAWADAVAAIAQRHQLAVVYGYPERGADGRAGVRRAMRCANGKTATHAQRQSAAHARALLP